MRGFKVFLKVPVIIIIRFGENVLETIYINIYQFWGGGVYIVHLTFICLLFIKTEKLQERILYYKQILYHFGRTIFFLGWIIKKIKKGVASAGWPAQIFLGIEYVVLTDIIAIQSLTSLLDAPAFFRVM